jgi:hypothetical protein
MKVSAYFNLGDVVLYGRWKNHRGRVVSFGQDKHGNPTIEIEPIPKGRKQNKLMGLYKIWHEHKDPVVAAEHQLVRNVCARFSGDDEEA